MLLDDERVLDNWKCSRMVFSVAETSNACCVGIQGLDDGNSQTIEVD